MEVSNATFRPKIQKLPPDLVNQIAAGEVVERPSSVVKELVENSLDAGASRIDILLKNGGIEEIQIVDNGCGMDREDLLLSVAPHATSKLFTQSDLESIGTYGFRGEALASIASVATLSITTRTPESDGALRLDLIPGRTIGDIVPTGAPVGTRITVSRLFEHVPARYKFLRSPSTELSHCAKMVKELAMGLPHVAFHLHHNGRHLHQYTATSRVARFQECAQCGWEPIEIVDETDGFSLHALLSPLEMGQERGDLFLFINGRIVRARYLLSAVKRVYQDLLGPHCEPSGVLFLEVRKDWVDVNVHPQKWEVRILQQERLFGWIIATVRKALGSSTVPPNKISSPTAQYQSATQHWFMDPKTHGEATGPRFVSTLSSSGLQVFEDSSGLMIIDGLRLSSDVYRKRLMLGEQKGWKTRTVLDAPVVASFTGDSSLLDTLGFSYEEFGAREVKIAACPSFIPAEMIARALEVIGRSTDSTMARKSVAELLAAQSSPNPFETFQLLTEIGYDTSTGECSSKAVFRLDFHTIKKHFEGT